ncbi:hypothetical protein [Pseudoxanthomonas yeongjuensis]|uniref:hypothetical protein n=1 Tax=Pseudoxanthomonas yeongjuensis TaxID=377616 RepID=UPI00139099E4|nr:hypothetical protein [Pseudoxanthomonas yeongjuensis]
MNISDTNKIDLHDAIVEKMTISLLDRLVEIRVKYYSSGEAKARSSGVIIFTSVSSLSGILDFDSIADNSQAGNINHWNPCEKDGTTFIYFLDGCLSVTAGSIQFDQA